MFHWGIWGLISLAFNLYTLVLLLRVIGSWVPPGEPNTPWAKILGLAYSLTEPLLLPIRRILAPYQRTVPFDFSPVVLLILLQVVERLLLRFIW